MPDYEWDDDKNKANQKKHGVAFEAVKAFDWSYTRLDKIEYVDGEEREAHIGPIGMALHTVILTEREDALRVISIRPANNDEIRRWRGDYHV